MTDIREWDDPLATYDQELNLAARDNIVSDGPGTAGYDPHAEDDDE